MKCFLTPSDLMTAPSSLVDTVPSPSWQFISQVLVIYLVKQVYNIP